MAISHDRLFKELLRTFLWEFLELFVPDLIPHLERKPPRFLEQEVFTDVTSGTALRCDVVARVRLHGEETHLLVHVESQAQPDPDFERRMFRYFARLHESHSLPVFPIALLSDRAVQGKEPGPDHYVVRAPHRKVLDFHFERIELKRYDWRDFLRSQNPVAAALMSRMKIAKRDRPVVKSACLRILAGLPLDPARVRLLNGFIDSYLNLDQKEKEQLMLEIGKLESSEAQRVLELPNSWEEAGLERGLKQGRQEGLQEGLSLVLQARFGEAAGSLATRLSAADAKQLKRLKAKILTASLADLEKLF